MPATVVEFGSTPGGAESSSYIIIKSLNYAVLHGAQIINMSFAGPYDPGFGRSLATARSRGIVLVAAAGNFGEKSPPQFPAADPNVIAVSATDADGVGWIVTREPERGVTWIMAWRHDETPAADDALTAPPAGRQGLEAGNRQQPGRNRRARLEGRGLAPDVQKHLAQDVLGQGIVAIVGDVQSGVTKAVLLQQANPAGCPGPSV